MFHLSWLLHSINSNAGKMFKLRKNIKLLKWCYSHIDKKRNVTTWSPLANHFNGKPEEDRWSFLTSERTVSIQDLIK